MTRLPMILAGFGLMTLTACGGGGEDGGGPVGSYVGLFDTGSTEASALSTRTLDPSSGSTGSASDDLERGTNTITLNGLTGTLNAARDTVTFDGGGTATIVNGATDYVALFSAEPASGLGDPFIGVVGVATEPGDLPGGTVTYTSANGARMTIIDGAGPNLFDLTGAVSVTVTFGSGNVDMTFSNLDGTRNGTGSFNDVATFDILGAGLAGNSISGGTASFAGTIGIIDSALSGNEAVATSAALYGPGADEIGGVVSVDDQSSGQLFIFTSFTAD